MEKKAHALMAGIFTLTLLIVAIMLGLWFNRDKVNWVPYEIATALSVPGLNPQAAVRYRGLDVGRVEEILFDPGAPGRLLIRIGVKPDTPITESTYGSLGYQGVTGIAYVQLDDDGSHPVKLNSSKQHIARITMRPSLLDNLQSKGLAILQQTEILSKRFNALLEPNNQKAMLEAFASVNKAALEIETIPKQLQPTLAKLPALSAEAQQTLASLTKLSKEIGVLSTNLNVAVSKLQSPDGALAKVANASDRVSAAADKIETEVSPLTREMRTTMRALDRTLDDFSQHPQRIIFGNESIAPGPGEAGYVAPVK